MRHVTQEPESAESLLTSIASEEERQEARVQQALAGFRDEEQEAARRFAEEETRTQDMFAKGAEEELRLYEEKEPKAVLERADAQAKDDASAFKASAKKNGKKVVADLLSKLVGFSFLSRP